MCYGVLYYIPGVITSHCMCYTVHCSEQSINADSTERTALNVNTTETPAINADSTDTAAINVDSTTATYTSAN